MSTRQTFNGILIVALASAGVGCAFGWAAGRASVEPLEVADAVPLEAAADTMTAPAQAPRGRLVEVTTDCIDQARASTTYPRTFRANVLESTHEPYGPGLWSVRVPFSAENAYGQRADYVAACREVVGGTLAIRIEDARP